MPTIDAQAILVDGDVFRRSGSDVSGASASEVVADATAADLSIVDAGTYFTGTDVEAALQELAAFVRTGELSVNTVASTGATETLTTADIQRMTMDQNCTFTFPTPAGSGHGFILVLSGAFTPTFPASVDWDSGAGAPTYASPSWYTFVTADGGTTWLGTLVASGLA